MYATASLSGGSEIQGFTVADATNDGLPDAVFVNQLSNDVYVFPGNGRGGFGTPSILSTGRNHGNIAVGNFNADRYLDAVVSQPDGGRLLFLSGSATGFSVGAGIPLGETPRNLTAIDFNRDGLLDLVVYLGARGCFTVMLGTGRGSFGTPSACILSTGSLYSAELTAFDWDGDGADELVDTFTSGALRVHRPTGAASLTQLVSLVVGSGVWTSALDLNHDGRPELMVVNHPSPGTLSVVTPGSGRLALDCSLRTYGLLGAGTTGSGIPVDVNLDGRIDWLYRAVSSSGPVYVATQQP